VATANARAESSVTLHPIKKTEIKTRIARSENRSGTATVLADGHQAIPKYE
jgi:hypothetical protein